MCDGLTIFVVTKHRFAAKFTVPNRTNRIASIRDVTTPASSFDAHQKSYRLQCINFSAIVKQCV